MSDDLDIRHGAVVSVDTETLRAVAVDLAEVRGDFDDAVATARDVRTLLEESIALGGGEAAMRATERTRSVIADLDRESDRSRELAENLLAAAAVYEYAELSARRDATTDPAQRARCEAMMAELRMAAPGIDLAAAVAGLGFGLRAPWELMGQAFMGGGLLGPGMATVLPLTVLLGAGFVRAMGGGTVPAQARLQGHAPPVTLTALSRGTATPVTSVADAARRVPREGSIRVEKYTMPGGGHRFVAYVAGMGSGPVFGMRENLELYSGRTSASYQAVRQALEASGAEPGDIVDGVGHSQGAMILDRLALEGEYDVETEVTFGSPVEADASASTLVVDVRHDDDPVSALADGGLAQGVGSPDSFVAQRTSDPGFQIGDVALQAHQMTSYTETAEVLDTATDPRMDAVRDYFDELGEATSVEVAVYAADLAESSGGGGE